MDKTQQLQDQITKLQQDFASLNAEYYKNNFSAQQDFNKYSNFKTRLKVPSYTADPTNAEVGEIIEVSGKLKICTTASKTAAVFTICGTQS